MTFEYFDEYLQITENQEKRAIKEVQKLKITDEFYFEKLVILKTSIICCVENQTRQGDLYEIKLKFYRDEFEKEIIKALQNEENIKNKNKINNFHINLYRS